MINSKEGAQTTNEESTHRDPADVDRDLIDRVLTGSDEAWNEFVSRFQRLIYSIAVRDFRLQSADADEVFQQVFVRLLQHDRKALRAWTGDGSLVAYVAAVTRRVAVDRLRAERRHPGAPGADDGDDDTRPEPVDPRASPEDVAYLEECRRLVLATAEKALVERDLALIQHWLAGRTYNEIADALGMTVNHVGVALRRAIQRLRQSVDRELSRRTDGNDDAQA